MPAYVFTCDGCGPFELSRSAAAAAAPADCPACRGQARRVFTPPGLVRTPKALARARGQEEKSAHEPAVVDRPVGRPLHAHAHADCPGHGSQAPPWVLSH